MWSLRYRSAISGMTVSSVTQVYRNHAIFVTQTIPLAQSERMDTFPPALSAKHASTHPA